MQDNNRAGDVYSLCGMFLDGENADAGTVYPEGASITLYPGGEGIFAAGEMSCPVSWKAGGDEISIMINELEASGLLKNGILSLDMGDTGLRYVFSSGAAAQVNAPSQELTPLQKKWNANLEGRIWFSETEGEWEDYESCTIGVAGSSTLDEAGNGAILLHSPGFSDVTPVIALNVSVDEVRARQLSGFVMDYPCLEGDIDISLRAEKESEIETTVFIVPEEFDWYIPDMNILPAQDEEREIEVMRLSGRCGDENGGFSFMAVLQRSEARQ